MLANPAYLIQITGMSMHAHDTDNKWRATTILAVRKSGKIALIGDGQVSLGQTVMKGNARKVRQLIEGKVLAGFAGATADAFTLFERLQAKLERYPDQLQRAAVELAKEWRTEKYLQKLEAMLIVADKDVTLLITGQGDVIEPEHNVLGIGSGGHYAIAAARASSTQANMLHLDYRPTTTTVGPRPTTTRRRQPSALLA